MYNVKNAPKGSQKVVITMNVTDAASEEIKKRADSERMSIDDFVVHAGYINPAIHSIRYLQTIGNPDNPSLKSDVDLIKDTEIGKSVSECFEQYKAFLGRKYADVFFDCTTGGVFTRDEYLRGDLHPVKIKTTEWDRENLKVFSALFGISLNEYLLFATTYEKAYIRPIDLKEGISYLNQMLDKVKLVSDTDLRRRVKRDILAMRNHLNLLCEANAKFVLGNSCR